VRERAEAQSGPAGARDSAAGHGSRRLLPPQPRRRILRRCGAPTAEARLPPLPRCSSARGRTEVSGLRMRSPGPTPVLLFMLAFVLFPSSSDWLDAGGGRLILFGIMVPQLRWVGS
jgi:hypothetical protein